MRVIFLFLLVASVSGCRHHRRELNVAGPGMNVKREATLLESAASRLQCPRNQLLAAYEASLETNYHVYRVDGCGKRFYALLHCTGICNWREAPEMRAEVELQCPVTQLQRAYNPSNDVFTMSGCGRSVSYELGQGHLRPVKQDVGGLPPVVVMPPPSNFDPNTPPPPPPPPPTP